MAGVVKAAIMAETAVLVAAAEEPAAVEVEEEKVRKVSLSVFVFFSHKFSNFLLQFSLNHIALEITDMLKVMKMSPYDNIGSSDETVFAKDVWKC